MSYASLLAVTSGAADDADTLKVAADLAHAFGAVAQVLPSYPEIPAMAWSDAFGATYFSAETWDSIYEAQRSMRYKALEQAKAAASSSHIAFGDDPVSPRLTMAKDAATLRLGLQRELALTDLVVAGYSATQGEGPWIGVLDEAMIDGRSPVLIARGGVSLVGRPAAVAWDGSPQAGRAVRAAMPLLKKAASTLILQDIANLDEGERDHADPGLLADYLERQGVANVSARRLVGDGREEIEKSANSAQVGLLVAGAYGHSRLRQAVLGGVTRTLLASSVGPHLFLTH
jgi:nucleotide-binding universal stress UspA family protein